MNRNLLKGALAAGALLVLAGCGGGGTTERLPPTGGNPLPSNYSGPPPATDQTLAFMNSIWTNVRASGVAGCGSCHNSTQSPFFAREDDINLAFSAALPLLNSDQPSDSGLVQKLATGHNCWLGTSPGSIQACADTMINWIEAWAGGVTGGTRQIILEAPPLKNVGNSRSYPLEPDLFGSTVYPVLEEYCSACHSSSAAIQQSPFFADGDVATAYAAAKTRMDLDDPANSRFVLRLGQEFHNCWSDCAANADTMEAAIAAFAQQVPVTEVDPSLVLSKALSMYQGIVASGGSRYEGAQIALWQFKEGSGKTAFDTSGVQPAINLTLSGDVEWVGGWGINIRSGKAQGSTASSRKLHDLIKANNEYTVEAWVAPGNVNQMDARIVTYSAGTTQRNFTLGQTQYSYDFHNRSSVTDANGAPVLQTDPDDQDAQATLQHVVLTYDAVNGRRIYVNGNFTGDTDGGGGTLGDWDDSFALVLGNEASNDRQWTGVIRLVAIHNRALTESQIQANFDAGVGEKFFLLFNVGEHVGRPDAYVLFEVSQFDSYSYLFNQPVFIVLDDEEFTPSSIPVRGMRIGVNGVEVPVSQAYRNLDTVITLCQGGDSAPCYTRGSGQVLSSLGTVIPLSKGPDDDEFFLTFERIGDSSNVVTEPAPLEPPPPPDGEPRSDIGVKIFDEINATMAAVTGVSPTNPAVKATYALVKQQLPAVESLEAFLASHQIGVAQLAIEYCNALVEDEDLRDEVFGTFDFDEAAGDAFNTPEKRDQVVLPLLTRIMGTNLNSQPNPFNVRLELDNLITTLTACGGSCPANRTPTVVKSVCSAALGSAVTLIQ
jgi:hypothetical protein